MDSVPLIILNLFFVFLLVIANGFFVAVEFAIVRSHLTKFREPGLFNKFGTKSAIRLIEELELSLSATQLGITIASLVLGWFGEQFFAHLFEDLFLLLSIDASPIIIHGLGTSCALIVVTFLHVVIGELAAKSLAIRYPESTLRATAATMVLFTEVCRPIIFILNEAAFLLLRAFGLKAAAESERVHTSRELSMLIAASVKHGELDKEEEQMLQGVFDFSETVAREIMTPRTDVTTLKITDSFDTVFRAVVESGHSRFPVIGENIDDVKGVLLLRDVLRASVKIIDNGDRESFSIKNILRESFFIPETKRIDDLLSELKRKKVHLAVVLDEHGGFHGIVTLEDIIEEIVGEIFDESDGTKLDIVKLSNGDTLIDGGVLVSDLNEELKIKIPLGEYDTVAGFMFAALGRIAESGDCVVIHPKRGLFVNDDESDSSSYILSRNQELQGVIIENIENGSEIISDNDSMEDNSEVILLKIEQINGNRIELIRLVNNEQTSREILNSINQEFESSST